MNLLVDAAAGLLQAGERSIRCSIGRSKAIAAASKTEGDGATPLGTWPLRGLLFRPDRVPPVTPDLIRCPAVLTGGEEPGHRLGGLGDGEGMLAWRWLRTDDGWSDDPADPAYNRPVRHPHGFSAERLWREDGLYDAIVVLGYNDAPPRPGAGSAIFLHCWKDGAATEGCVAVAREELLALLPELRAGDTLTIR